MFTLKSLGWDDFFRSQLNNHINNGLVPGRIAAENKTNYAVYTEFGELTAEVTGKLLFASENSADLPKTGDWVLLNYFEDENKGIIQEVLERKTKLSRKAAGQKTEEQIFASNIDFVFIVHPIDGGFNFNKLERQLVPAYQSKAEPIVILSKSDLCEDVNLIVDKIKKEHPGVTLVPTSIFDNTGIDLLKQKIEESKTYILIGSSGAGKSSLINALFGDEVLKTGEVRSKDLRGKHTTTRREFIILPQGGILIDTPGIRELQLWDAGEGLTTVFNEYEDIAGECKYKDCTHTQEKGCAVIEALNKGKISQKKYDNYLKMRKELQYLETKQDYFAAKEKERKWKNIKKELKRYYKKHKG